MLDTPGVNPDLVASGRGMLSSTPNLVLDLNFIGGVLPSIVTFSRASSATDSFFTDTAGSSFNTYTSGVARMLATGFLPEPASTQRLLNSAAPVTQTTASLATGTYVFWCIGTGSVTSSAGTATASGLGAITGSQGTFQTIVVTVAGTLIFTVSGSINRFQLELGAVPTSFISSGGATATRAADVATVTLSSAGIPANPAALTIVGKARTSSASPASNQWLGTLDDGTLNNRFGIQRNAGGNAIQNLIENGGVTSVSQALYTPAANNTDFRVWLAARASDAASQVIGQAKVTSGAAVMPAGLTTLSIGSTAAGAAQWNSTIARLQIFNTRLSDAQAAAIAAGT